MVNFSIILLFLHWWFIFFYNSMAFLSKYECKLDAQGRLVLPAKIKANLPDASNELIIMKGFDPNLVLFPKLEYNKMKHKFISLSDFDKEQRMLKRRFFSSVTLIEFDITGRFIIPKDWIKHAKLKKQVVIIGIGNTIEIWNPDLLHDNDKFMINDEEKYEEMIKKFLDV